MISYKRANNNKQHIFAIIVSIIKKKISLDDDDSLNWLVCGFGRLFSEMYFGKN